MKHPTMQKVMLTTVALAASLAFSARAGQPKSATAADSISKHVQSEPAQAQSRPVVLPHQIDGIDCESAPGIVIHDDGGIENGYSGAPGLVTEVRFTDKFTPSSYPASYSSVCLDFVILAGGPATYPIDVVVFDDDGAGGSPGTLLGELNGQTATTHLFSGGGQPPIWNSYDISSLGLNITSGSVYIGARWVPPSNNVFLSADESGPVGFAGGYWWNNFDGVWSQTQNAFPGYTANFIRAVEAGAGGGEITLTAKLRRQKGQRFVALSWSPADGGSINVVRDGAVIHTTDDDGRAQDPVGAMESHTYQVCETDTGTCSNEVTVQIPGASGQ